MDGGEGLSEADVRRLVKRVFANHPQVTAVVRDVDEIKPKMESSK